MTVGALTVPLIESGSISCSLFIALWFSESLILFKETQAKPLSLSLCFNFYVKADNKYFKLSWYCGLGHSHSTGLLQHGSSHKEHRNIKLKFSTAFY